MTIELVIVGDEILSGRTVDANLAWFAPWLTRRGLKLSYVSVVGDDPKAMLAALEAAWKRSQIILTSGGIGPTKDDLTKNILAQFAAKKLQPNPAAQKIVEKNYSRIQRDWTPETNDYHIIPEGFIATDNPTGLAPGLVWMNDGHALMAAPGVPREFANMVEEVFFPLLEKNNFPVRGDAKQVVIRTHGIPEEKIFGEISPMLWQDLERFGKVSSLPHVTGVDIVISYQAQTSSDEIAGEIKKLKTIEPLSSAIWQWGALTLEEYLLQVARVKKLKLAFAESCTGGLVANLMTNIAGSSDVFMGSAVTYANQAKENILQVNSETLREFGAVSENVAREMALGARENFKADMAVSFSGIAGPGGGTKEKPVGLVCQGFASEKEVLTRSLNFRGDRIKLKERFAISGMMWMLQKIQTI